MYLKLFVFIILSTLPSMICAQTATTPSSCARLAEQTGMKQQNDGQWRVNMLGGIGTALFGGTSSATFQVEPIDGSIPDQAFDKMCAQTGGEIACNVTGPARIKVGTKRGDATADIAAGEKVVVGMKGRHLTCRESN